MYYSWLQLHVGGCVSTTIVEQAEDKSKEWHLPQKNLYQTKIIKRDQNLDKKLEPKKRKSLSQATLETLTIIAYKQPITKVEIESIRGVKCDKVLQTLLEHELIREAGRLNKIGKPIIYKTTQEFLKLLQIESLKDLPPIDTFEGEEEI